MALSCQSCTYWEVYGLRIDRAHNRQQILQEDQMKIGEMPVMPGSVRPNILLIMTDQHRGDCLGVSGHPLVQTPHLDSLARDGVNFTKAYSACPSCIPARAILITGQTPWHAGILGMGQGQREMRSDYRHTIAGCLAAAGYHTQLVGKMHFQAAEMK